jgi:hypothetical protein
MSFNEFNVASTTVITLWTQSDTLQSISYLSNLYVYIALQVRSGF